MKTVRNTGMAGIGKKITSFFRSRKLAIVLILLIILFSIIGTHVPQKWQLKPDVYNTWKANHPGDAELFERLGLTNLFSSYIFITLAALLFINTLFCTASMLRTSARLLARKPLFQDSGYISRLENYSVIQTGGADKGTAGRASAEMGKILAAHGYMVEQDGSRLFAEKNRFGVLAIPLFHVCILLIISAGVYGATGRMEGDIRLIEGQDVPESHESYVFLSEGPLFNDNHANLNITLDRFYPQYADETGTERGPAGELTIIRDGEKVKSGIVYSNNMLDYGGFTFLNNVYGMAPLLLILNPDGTVYTGSY
ncbi:MAG TPA: cytochrome c biogenesis protein ResB, partial [Candidatus Methanoperedenaceae archaeon]|nr:cytochrome c biogenesis protein ResB [Candidatus Methanoperedenaceae archaeon]